MSDIPIILGIDPGTRITGYGLIKAHQNGEIPLDFGCIRPSIKLELNQKYVFIYKGLEELIKKYKPDAIAVETQFVKKNVQSAMKLGMARGVVILAAALNNIPIFEYAPKKAKLAVTGTGAASKSQVQKMVQMLLKLKELPTPEDAADALSIAICHAHYHYKEGNFLCTNL
jgi:crossover junction endodeoxyribonuclease RuvC